jgi:hypothetical protein
LKALVDDVVYPFITQKLDTIIADRKDWCRSEKELHCTACDCCCSIGVFEDRFASLVQPYQHHARDAENESNGVFVYTFGLNPKEYQPSGTFSVTPRRGLCYRCVLVYGLPEQPDLKEESFSLDTLIYAPEF